MSHMVMTSTEKAVDAQRRPLVPALRGDG